MSRPLYVNRCQSVLCHYILHCNVNNIVHYFHCQTYNWILDCSDRIREESIVCLAVKIMHHFAMQKTVTQDRCSVLGRDEDNDLPLCFVIHTLLQSAHVLYISINVALTLSTLNDCDFLFFGSGATPFQISRKLIKYFFCLWKYAKTTISGKYCYVTTILSCAYFAS